MKIERGQHHIAIIIGQVPSKQIKLQVVQLCRWVWPTIYVEEYTLAVPTRFTEFQVGRLGFGLLTS